MKDRLMVKYGVFGSILLVLLVRIPFDLKPFHNVDEGVLATLANIISDGGLIYRDGWDHRGPLLSYVYAGIFSLFGQNNMIAVHLITTLVIGTKLSSVSIESFFFKKNSDRRGIFFLSNVDFLGGVMSKYG
jgi:predicted membrane-bound mannosyltransferase